MRQFVGLAALVLALGGPAYADEAKPAVKDDVAKAVDAATAHAPVLEKAQSSSMSVSLPGRVLKYKATAGTLTIRNDDGKPTGSLFYVAYVMDAPKGTERPVTFLYNGGPGSSSLWLHMGSFAPMRLEATGPTTMAPAPFKLGPNPETLLGDTDLVFIDAMGAGFSRPIGDTPAKAFYGVDQDVDAFARAIERYVTLNGRWNSPKYLFGESYGTLRSGALANKLQDRGMYLNGVVLLSSILNYGMRQPGFDHVFQTYLPTYAATAWYHSKVANRPADVASFVQEARDYAHGPYAAALAKGDQIPADEKARVAAALSRFTGLSVDFILQNNLRVELGRFRKELLRDQRLTVGRLDSRYTGVDADAGGDSPEFDASSTAVTGAYVGAVRDYITHTLGYQTDLDYRQSARDGGGFSWDWKHQDPEGRTQTTPDTAVDLSSALRVNPKLRVLSLNGYYDMATPFFGTEFDIAHMMLEPQQRANVSIKYYPSGHMVYMNLDALKTMSADVSRFVSGGDK